MFLSASIIILFTSWLFGDLIIRRKRKREEKRKQVRKIVDYEKDFLQLRRLDNSGPSRSTNILYDFFFKSFRNCLTTSQYLFTI